MCEWGCCLCPGETDFKCPAQQPVNNDVQLIYWQLKGKPDRAKLPLSMREKKLKTEENKYIQKSIYIRITRLIPFKKHTPSHTEIGRGYEGGKKGVCVSWWLGCNKSVNSFPFIQ